MSSCLKDQVRVVTGARLHFGPLSVAAPAGGRFGGVGVMIDRPGVTLTARAAPVDQVVAEPDVAARTADFLQRIRTNPALNSVPGLKIEVTQSIPSHCGFGSGTQLGLAVARAVSVMMNEPDSPAEQLARCTGRGLRSAVGLHGFLRGGFLVDGGRCEPGQLGTLVARVDFPSEWRFVLAMPNQSIGLSGEAEKSTFATQPPMPVAMTAELCRTVLMDWLPAIIERDFPRCSESMYRFGRSVGEFFSSAQGGIFANRRMMEWAETIRHLGVEGVAQTSWGPTLAALCPDQLSADQLQADFSNDPSWSDCTFEVVSPLNRGASVDIEHLDD